MLATKKYEGVESRGRKLSKDKLERSKEYERSKDKVERSRMEVRNTAKEVGTQGLDPDTWPSCSISLTSLIFLVIMPCEAPFCFASKIMWSAKGRS